MAASKLLAEHGVTGGGDSQLAREVDSYELENRALRAELERLQAESTVAQLRAGLKVANDEVARLRVSDAAMAQALYGSVVDVDGA